MRRNSFATAGRDIEFDAEDDFINNCGEISTLIQGHYFHQLITLGPLDRHFVIFRSMTWWQVYRGLIGEMPIRHTRSGTKSHRS